MSIARLMVAAVVVDAVTEEVVTAVSRVAFQEAVMEVVETVAAVMVAVTGIR